MLVAWNPTAGNTLLHAAARYGRLNDVPPEVCSPENLLRKNDSGYTPLHHAAMGDYLSEIPAELLVHDHLLTRSNSGYTVPCGGQPRTSG